jgi:hypothetical protein
MTSTCYRLTNLCDKVSLHVWVQLLEEIARVLGAEPAQVLLLEEEVDAQVGFADNGRVVDRELPNARQDQVLERLEARYAGARVDQQNVRVFERLLARCSPQTQLSVVPGACQSPRVMRARAAYFLSLAVGPCTGGGRSAIIVCVASECIAMLRELGIGSVVILPGRCTHDKRRGVGRRGAFGWGRQRHGPASSCYPTNTMSAQHTL